MDGKAGRQEAPRSDLAQVLYLEQEISALEKNIIDAKEELENLQNELVHTKKKKAESEVQAKDILENAEKRKKVFLEDIEVLTKQKSSLEKQCADLSAKSGQLSNDLSVKSKELQDKNTELEEARNQLNLINRDRKPTSKKRKFSLIVVLGVSVAVMLFGRNYFDGEISELKGEISGLNGEISELDALYQDAKTGQEQALEKLSDMEEYAGNAMVKVNKVYNADANKRKISDDLKASEMRYLHFDFDVCFLDDNVKEATIYLDIYNPDGSLRFSFYSPTGHTFSPDVDESGNVNEGWGNSEKSTYTSGTYRVDYIYKNVIIHSQKVVISD